MRQPSSAPSTTRPQDPDFELIAKLVTPDATKDSPHDLAALSLFERAVRESDTQQPPGRRATDQQLDTVSRLANPGAARGVGDSLSVEENLSPALSRTLEPAKEQKLTFGQRLADRVAETMGSWRFITTQAGILAGWVLWNCIPGLPHFDPYPFIFLNLALSCQAAFAAPVIMMSQNRQSEQDRNAEKIDHDVNRRAEIGVEAILERLEDLQGQVGSLREERQVGQVGRDEGKEEGKLNSISNREPHAKRRAA